MRGGDCRHGSVSKLCDVVKEKSLEYATLEVKEIY